MSQNKALIFLVFILISGFMFLDSKSNLDKEMASLKRELVSRVNNIDKMASLISKMPALTGAIEFQSFNQLDVVIDNMFKDDTCLKKFFIVDDGENILHSISSSVVGSMKIPAGLVRKSKSSVYNFVNGKLYLLKEVKSQFSDTSYQIYFEVDYLKILNERLELLKLEPLNSIELELSTNKTNFDFLVLNDLDRQLSYLEIYFSKNLLKLISLFLLMFFTGSVFVRLLVSPIRGIISSLKNISSNDLKTINLKSYPLLFRPIVKNIIDANKSIKEANDKQQASELQKTKNEATAKVARQVVHDIKSPLTSLEFLVKSAGKKLVESERLIAKQSIERISDILSTLSIKNSNSEKSEIKEELVDSLIKRIISEKRLEFKSKENVEIELINELPYGSFVNISKSSFLRAISNLVNNSSEAAVDGKNILITIKLEVADDKCRISIMDNGKGIDKEKIFTVFDHGVSYDKELGSGLGLTYAKDTIEKLNGKLSLNSIKGEGTTVLIDLPLVTAPQWFKTSVTISSQYICIIDDDDSIHSIWNELLVNLDVDIKHFKHAAEFERWYLSYGKGLDCLYMFDLELIGSNKNGLDLIEEYNLTNFSTLVTSHYDDNQVQLRALKNNIKIIPKDLVANISIKSSIDSEQGIVLIDDDELVHLSWKLASKRRNVKLSTYYTIDSFIENSENFDKDIPIYIDSMLADGVRGDIESKRIYDLGFKNLSLASGMSYDILPKWIRSNQGKSFPLQ